MPKAYDPGRFGGNNIGNRLLLEAAGPQMGQKAEEIMAEIGPPVADAVDKFFGNLAEYMGKNVDLLSQLGGAQIGLRPWNPLTQAYIREKQGDLFYLYTLSNGATGFRRRNHQRLSKKKIGGTLINQFKGASGNMFGPPVLKLTSQGITLEEFAATRERTVIPRGRGRAAYTKIERFVETISMLRFQITIRLWSKFAQKDLSGETVDRFVADHLGGDSEETFNKLTNPRGVQRPLVRPYMAYYSQYLIPQIISNVIKQRFKTSFTGGSRAK